MREDAHREVESKNKGKEDLAYEIVIGEPMSNEEADQLATLFARALVRKLLRKGSTDVHTRPGLKG